MAQIFPPVADTCVKLAGIAVAVLVVGGLMVAGGAVRSDWLTRVGVAPDQPVPFSHKHHAGELGIDCRYCHDDVERSASAGFPPTKTCMTCHSQLWTNAEALAPVRSSFTTGEPLAWNRVHDLPDYVYFNHSIHVAHGVGCVECHGRIDRMNRVAKVHALYMSWCLDCHRDPAPHLRPPERVFDLDWQPPADARALGSELVARFGIEPANLDSCYVCHR